MTWFHGVQLALSACVVGVVAVRLWELSLASAIDTRPYLDALRAAYPERLDRLTALLVRGRRSAVGRLATALVEAGGASDEGDDLHAALQREAVTGIRLIRTFGRVAMPLALTGVMFELAWALSGGEGLVALQRGLAARVAIEHAAAGVSIGVCTSLFCALAASVLQRLARSRLAELRLTMKVLGSAPAPREET